MTELNIAYSFNGGNSDLDDNSAMDYHSEQPSQQQQQQQQPPPPPPQPPQLQPPQQAPIYYQQQAPPPIRKPPQQYQTVPQYSFWDRMMLSRNDVFKLILLAFVVVLGISIEKLGSHYINTYLTDNILSPIQEFIVRLSYPLLIFIFLWIIKSL
jgi:hypothetical protein|uniref:Uncharacterized protein n=1 Tax=viral metagenome TaxID=1070528 RepID=A0A6C0LIX0_9ZZZZ